VFRGVGPVAHSETDNILATGGGAKAPFPPLYILCSRLVSSDAKVILWPALTPESLFNAFPAVADFLFGHLNCTGGLAGFIHLVLVPRTSAYDTRTILFATAGGFLLCCYHFVLLGCCSGTL
jgi:hypothetical protein